MKGLLTEFSPKHKETFMTKGNHIPKRKETYMTKGNHIPKHKETYMTKDDHKQIFPQAIDNTLLNENF